MALEDSIPDGPISRRALAVSWLVMTFAVMPLWIWQDGRYGLLKAGFFALFFAYVYKIKRNTLDTAVFAFIMTGLHLFSRQVVSYHQLVIDAYPPELLVLLAHAALTLLSAWLMSWLFDLRHTPGPTYTRLAAYYMMFYFAEFICHALVVMFWQDRPFTLRHPQQYALLLLAPLALWWLGSKLILLVNRNITPFKAEASWKRRFRDFENTRAVVFSCLALYAAGVVWFGFVHFAIAKLGLADHYVIAQGCAAIPALGDFMLHALSASVGWGDSCLVSASLASRATNYLQITLSLFLLLVLVQALALALSAERQAEPPKKPE
ncbi:MAG: hypothetical protein HZA67_11865 [Rhodospirillales bacterium]|jgi:hypothetical protein|nr:hypothetical protein [Rhodospirillales bacterium]